MIESSEQRKDENYENVPLLMSLGEHIDELRRYLLRIILVFVIVFVCLLFFKNFLFQNIIFAPKESWFITNKLLCKLAVMLNIESLCINNSSFKLINIQLVGQFTAHLLITLFSALILIFPYILSQIWLFVKPALYPAEIKKMRKFATIASLLFFMGIMFGYYIILPLTINFLGNYKVSPDVENTISLMSYVSTVSLITLIMGFVFQLPVLIYFLNNVGLITPEFLRKNRKIIIVVILILSAIITPPDVFSQILVAIPLYVLYEISIVISKRKVNN